MVMRTAPKNLLFVMRADRQDVARQRCSCGGVIRLGWGRQQSKCSNRYVHVQPHWRHRLRDVPASRATATDASIMALSYSARQTTTAPTTVSHHYPIKLTISLESSIGPLGGRRRSNRSVTGTRGHPGPPPAAAAVTRRHHRRRRTPILSQILCCA